MQLCTLENNRVSATLLSTKAYLSGHASGLALHACEHGVRRSEAGRRDCRNISARRCARRPHPPSSACSPGQGSSCPSATRATASTAPWSSRTPHRARCWPAVRPRPSDEDERSSECPGARWPIPASRCVAQTLPERAKLRHALARRVSGDQRAVDRADRCPDHSVRLDACVRERLEDTGLVGAESASALEDEDDLSGKRMSFCLHGPVLFGLMK